MVIYLDESGDLGFNLNHKKTSRYLVIGLLVCLDEQAHAQVRRSVKRTLRNKLPQNSPELKGYKLSLSIKMYFLKEITKAKNWRLYVAVADKKSWATHYFSSHGEQPNKKVLYNEVAKRLFSQLDSLEGVHHVDIIVDRSKNKREIIEFDKLITSAIGCRMPKNSALSIKHRCSPEDLGLPAIDIFCSGIGKKYEQADNTWCQKFTDRIAVEVEYKF